jgi:hypothetical protein
MAALGGQGPINLTEMGKPEQIDQAQVTPNLLDTLGVQPALGASVFRGGRATGRKARGDSFGRTVEKKIWRGSQHYWKRHFAESGELYDRGGAAGGIPLSAARLPARHNETAFQLAAKKVGLGNAAYVAERRRMWLIEARRLQWIKPNADWRHLSPADQIPAIPTMFAHMRDGLAGARDSAGTKSWWEMSRPTLLMLLRSSRAWLAADSRA